jgi:hypothetical protein
MSELTQAATDRVGPTVRTVRAGIAVLVAMAAIVVYGSYGGTHPDPSQERAVPALIAVMTVVVAAIFAGLVAPGLRALATRTGRWAGIGLTLGIIGLVAVPVASWAGLPLTLGTAAALLGSAGRVAAARDGRPGKLPAWALGLGIADIVLSVVMVVVGNTVLS